MFLNIIPKELKTEILREESLIFADHVALMKWCRARCNILQQENLAGITKRALQSYSNGGKPVGSIEQEDEDAPVENPPAPWTKDLIQLKDAIIAAIQPPPAPHAAPRPDRGRGRNQTSKPNSRDNSRDRAGRQRSPSGGRRQPNRLVGWDNRCYHCGSKDHTRPDCAEFAKMMKAANPGVKDIKKMKPPAGYKSALAKARDAQKLKDKKVAALIGDSAEDSASDDDCYSEAGSFAIAPVRALTPFRPVPKGTPWLSACRASSTQPPVASLN